jgi:hypothetical protein
LIISAINEKLDLLVHRLEWIVSKQNQQHCCKITKLSISAVIMKIAMKVETWRTFAFIRNWMEMDEKRVAIATQHTTLDNKAV